MPDFAIGLTSIVRLSLELDWHFWSFQHPSGYNTQAAMLLKVGNWDYGHASEICVVASWAPVQTDF